MMSKIGQMIAVWMLLAVLCLADPFEPTVNSKEAELLKQVSVLGQTNAVAAIALVRKTNVAKASPAVDFALGNLYFQSDKLDEAAKSYQAALKKLPKFRSAMMNLGRVYLLQEKTGDAIQLYQDLVRDGQADADILILLGRALLLEQSAVSAENAYRQALLLKPGNVNALSGLARCLLLQQRYQEGQGLTRELIKHNAANKEYWLLRANALLAMDQSDDALRVLETARRIGSIDAEMLAMLGDLYLNADQPDEAVARYEEAFSGKKPSVARLLRATEGFLMLHKTDHAARLIEKVDRPRPVGLAPEHQRQLLRLKVDLHQQKGDPKAAQTLCQQILRENPMDGDILLALGDLQQGAGELETAVMTFERAARVRGHEVRALLRQAQVEVARDRYVRAVELLETAQTFEEQPHVARYLEQVRRLAQYSERASR